MLQRGFTSVILILVGFLILSGVIVGGVYYIKNDPDLFNQIIGLKIQSQTLQINKNIGNPLKLSIINSINKGHLQDHNYGTLITDSSQSYTSDINHQNNQPVSIGYNYQEDINRSNKYTYQTTQDGKYLLRSTAQTIEISSASQIEVFTKIFEVTDTRIDGFLVSEDGSKLVVFYDQSGKKIAIQDLTNPQNRIIVTPERESDSYTIFGYDTKQSRIYWARSKGPMTHYTEIVSIDKNGKIIKTQNVNDYSFITEYDSDFKYAYYDGYVSGHDDKSSIVQLNLQTGQKKALVKLNKDDSPVHIKLSPLGNTLVFFNNLVLSGGNKLYIVNILTDAIKTIDIPAGFFPAMTNYISPDGKYLLLSNGGSCHNGFCAKDISHVVLYSIDDDKFYTYHQPVGVKGSFEDDSNSTKYHNIETMATFGWLGMPTTEEQPAIILPQFNLQAALATPTLNPIASGDYPLMQIDLSKSKEFFYPTNYPDEILNASSANLIGMKCAPQVFCQPPYDYCWRYDEKNYVTNKVIENDPQFIKSVKQAAQSIGGKLTSDELASVTSCQTQDGDRVLFYQSLGNADPTIRVGNGKDYLGFTPINGEFKKIDISEPPSKAHTCFGPIMFTKTLDFYLTCNTAEEGPSLHKVNLQASTDQILLTCNRTTNVCK